jgi:hypothetical protein
MAAARLAWPLEEFAVVARRLELVPRVVSASEWLLDGSDRDEVLGLLADLERELVRAIAENEAAGLDDQELRAA